MAFVVIGVILTAAILAGGMAAMVYFTERRPAQHFHYHAHDNRRVYFVTLGAYRAPELEAETWQEDLTKLLH